MSGILAENVSDIFVRLKSILNSNADVKEKIKEIHDMEEESKERYRDFLLKNIDNSTVKHIINKVSRQTLEHLDTVILKYLEKSLNNNKDIENLVNFILDMTDNINVILHFPYAQFEFYLKGIEIARMWMSYDANHNNNSDSKNYIEYIILGSSDNEVLKIIPDDLKSNTNLEKVYRNIIRYLREVKEAI